MQAGRTPLMVIAAVLLAGCAGVKLQPIAIPNEEEIRNKLNIEDIPYIHDDTFIGNPLALLGQVIEVRKVDGVCPRSWAEGKAEFSVEPVAGYTVDSDSVLKTPTKRDSKVITAAIAAKIGFLSYLSSELQNDQVISAILFDQAGGRVSDAAPDWSEALKKWRADHADLFANTEICYLAVVKGMIQKNLVRRTFAETKASAAGGAYGVNVNGKYHTSSEDYSIDVRFGLSIGLLKRPETPAGFDIASAQVESAPTQSEVEAIRGLQVVAHKGPAITNP
jgi:hypothetical protein